MGIFSFIFLYEHHIITFFKKDILEEIYFVVLLLVNNNNISMFLQRYVFFVCFVFSFQSFVLLCLLNSTVKVCCIDREIKVLYFLFTYLIKKKTKNAWRICKDIYIFIKPCIHFIRDLLLKKFNSQNYY